MDQAPNNSQEPPVESKLQSFIRVLGLGVIVLILWSVDKVAVSRLPPHSIWRYVVGGVIVFVGLIVTLSISDRLNKKES